MALINMNWDSAVHNIYPKRGQKNFRRHQNRFEHEWADYSWQNKGMRGRRGTRDLWVEEGRSRYSQRGKLTFGMNPMSSCLDIPIFEKVCILQPQSEGVNVRCVVIEEPYISRTITAASGMTVHTWEVLVGDDTGCIFGWFLGNVEHLLVPGTGILIRNGKVVLKDGKSKRLLVNVKGRIELAEDLVLTPNLDKNFSDTGYR